MAVSTLALLVVVNCLGVALGTRVQSALMVLKTLAVLALVAAGLLFGGASRAAGQPLLDRPLSFDLLPALGAALVPVLFAYGGWHTAGFVAGELKHPERDMPRALLLGMVGVAILYLSVNWVCLRVLGPADLALTQAPASEVMRRVLGERGRCSSRPRGSPCPPWAS